MDARPYLPRGQIRARAIRQNGSPLALAFVISAFLSLRCDFLADTRMILQPWLLTQGFLPYVHSSAPPDYFLWFDNLEDLATTAPEFPAYVAQDYREPESLPWEISLVHILERRPRP